jgi:hypothetical protein
MVKRFGAVLLAVGFGVRRSALAFFGFVVFDKKCIMRRPARV